MEPQLFIAFPASIVATWIAIFIVLRAKAITREEAITGRTAKSNRFTFIWIGIIGGIYYFFDHLTFFNLLISMLFGMLIAGAVAYWLVHWWRSPIEERQQ